MSFSSTAKITIIILTLLLACGIQAPSIVFYLRKYWINRHHYIIQKRNVKAVIALNIMCLSFIVIQLPSSLIKHSFNLSGNGEKFFTIVLTICWILVPHQIIFCGLMKYWTTHFDIHWTIASQRGKWKQLVNAHAKPSNWYLRKKATFGNDSWMLKHVWAPSMIAQIIITTVLLQIEIHWYYAGETCIFLLQFIAFCKIWFQTPVYADAVLLYSELSMVMKLWLFTIMIYIMYGLWGIFDWTNEHWRLLATSWLFGSSFWGVSMVSTYYVLSFSNQRNLLMRTKSQISHETYELEKTTISSMEIPNFKLSRHAPLYRKFLDVLASPDAFDTFMQHLHHEFSCENALALIEMVQFRKHCRESMGRSTTLQKWVQSNSSNLTTVTVTTDSDMNSNSTDVNTGSDNLIDMLRLHLEMPQSSIVNDDKLEMTDKVKQLVKKYVDNSAKYPLNISYEARKTVLDMCESTDFTSDSSNYPLTKLDTLFDDIIFELVRLLRDSFSRFEKYLPVTSPTATSVSHKL